MKLHTAIKRLWSGLARLGLAMGVCGALAHGAAPEKLWQLPLSKPADDSGEGRTDDRISLGPDGTIYVASLGGTLTAVTPAGSNQWEVQVGRLYTSVPIAKDGAIVFGSYEGKLLAYATSGQRRWEFPLERSNPGSPGIGLDGTIYAAGRELYAISPEGVKKWAYGPSAALARCSCAQGPDGAIYVVDNTSQIHCVNPDGTARWIVPLPGASTMMELSRQGTLHLIANRKLYAIRPDGTTRWELPFAESVGSLARVDEEGTVYVISAMKLVAVSAAGEKKWAYDLEAANSKIPLLGHDRVIYAGTSEGKIHAINPDGTRRWLYDAGEAMGANLAQSAAGVLYFEAKSTLFAFATGKPAQPAKAARFRRDDNWHPERFQPPVKPDVPTGIAAAKGDSLTAVTISWQPAAQAAGYEIWRSEQPDPATAVALVKNLGGTTNYSDQTAVEGVTYYYWLKAVSPAGASEFSQPDRGSLRGKRCGDRLWQLEVGAPVYSTPAITRAGTLYVGTRGQKLLAVSAEGKIQWRYATGGDVDTSPVVAADGTIYVGAHDRMLHAVKPDGSRKWAFATGGFITASPVLGADGVIYFGSWDKKVYGLKPDGAKKWETALPDSIVAGLAQAADGTLYVGCDDGKLYALGADGARKWEFDGGGALHSAPAVSADGAIFFGSPDSHLYALDKAGHPQWSFATKQPVYGAPALAREGAILFTGGDGRLYALNPDGSKRWDYDGAAPPATSLALGADGSVYLGYGDGRLCALDREGKLQWSFVADGAIAGSPILGARGTVYFATLKGNLYALKGAPEAGDFAWSMHRQNPRRTAAMK